MYKIENFFRKIIKIFQYIPFVFKYYFCDDITYLLQFIKFETNNIAKTVKKNNYIIDEEIEFQQKFAEKLELTINKYFDSDKYFPMLNYMDLYNSDIDFIQTGENHEKYGKLVKMIDIFCDTEKEIPKGHEYYKYKEKYIKRIMKYETACWNRVWDMLKKDGYKLGD